MNPAPARLVLLGAPVAHSLSPLFQNAALARAGLPQRYEPLHVEPAQLSDVLRQLASEGAAGNITIPHKRAAAAHCARLTETAARVGAINTFWSEQGELVGDNTDVMGFNAAVHTLLGRAPRRERVVILGAGGAAAAALAAISEWTESSAVVVGRTPATANSLAERFSGVARAEMMSARTLADASMLVNATPVGIHGDEMPCPVEQVSGNTAVLDMTYRRGGTAWVRAARARGLRADDGLHMLVEQGAHSFERWFGIAPDRDAMYAALA